MDSEHRELEPVNPGGQTAASERNYTSSGPQPHQLHQAQDVLFKSLFAESILHTIAGQMERISTINQLPALKSVFEEDLQTGNHSLIAQGCLQRLGCHDWHGTILSQLVDRLYQARRHHRIKRGYLLELKRTAPTDARPAVENWIHWVDYAETLLQEAMIYTQELIGTQAWNRYAPK